jgi:hypothetical protein
MNDDIKEVTANDPDFGFQKEPSWTSVDLYYKGVHIKKSVPDNIKIEILKKTIDEYLEAGFQPSWNQDTNKAVQTVMPQTDLGVCTKCGAKNSLSKLGKVYCSARCWLPKQ